MFSSQQNPPYFQVDIINSWFGYHHNFTFSTCITTKLPYFVWVFPHWLPHPHPRLALGGAGDPPLSTHSSPWVQQLLSRTKEVTCSSTSSSPFPSAHSSCPTAHLKPSPPPLPPPPHTTPFLSRRSFIIVSRGLLSRNKYNNHTLSYF